MTNSELKIELQKVKNDNDRFRAIFKESVHLNSIEELKQQKIKNDELEK